MGSLFTSMVATAGAMRSLQRALSVVENNIVNASSVGYARQSMNLVANPFNPNTSSTSGGVSTGPMESSRNVFLEGSVWKAQHRSGFSNSLSGKLAELERSFPLTPGAGLSAQFDKFFGAISQWSVAPNSSVAREQVLERARGLTQSFQQTASDIAAAGSTGGTEIQNAVRQINAITTELADLNRQRRENRAGGSVDAGIDARLHARLEELAQYVNFTALPQEDGAVSILVGGQTTLVIGDNQYDLSVVAGANRYEVENESGAAITDQLTGGGLGGLLEFRNTVLPGVESEINTLATTFANQANAILAGGIDQNGNPPTKALFTINTTIGAAATIALTDITAQELTGAVPGDPGGNGNVLNFLEMKEQGLIGGLNFNEYFARSAAQLGNRLNTAKSDAALRTQLVLQAQNLRNDTSGVDINEEATKLLQLQKGFQAAGQVMTVLNSMTETLMTMMR